MWGRPARRKLLAMETQASFWHAGLVGRVLLDGTATGGQLGLLELRGRPGVHHQRHVHRAEDELLVVVEGRVQTGELVLGPGDRTFLPRGVPHDLRVLERTRLLCAFLPAGLEEVLRRACAPLTHPAPPPQERPGEDDLAAWLSTAGVTLLGRR
jgi:mannose-6-phosphate isomerase-like protein (cupin superfamily)